MSESGKPIESSAAPALAVGDTASAPEASRRMARLVRAIEGEIVPRLLLSLSGSLLSVREGRDCYAAAELAHLVLVRENVGAADIVRIIYPQGPPPPDRVCLGLIAPAARHLGEIWERNECNFDELLQGLSRLESVIREVNGQSAGP